MDVEVWKYQQQLATLSEMEAQKRAEMVLIRETLDREKERTLQKVYSDVQRQAQVLSKEVVTGCVIPISPQPRMVVQLALIDLND
ncbi:UNVERIFIED_CONTAM: hypothetical protein K2H54_035357 [Gekko kuhli]